MVGLVLGASHALIVASAPAHALAPLAGTDSPTLWYLTRASAIAAYALLTLTVILGMLRSVARQASERLSWVADELHQVAATLMAVMIVTHLLTLVFDPYLPFSVVNVLMPFGEPYRPTAVRIGVFALYVMALVLFTSWFRRRLSYRAWRGIHYFSVLAFVLTTAHGFLAGSDNGEPWMRAMYAGAAGAVAFLLLVRMFAGPAVSQQADQIG